MPSDTGVMSTNLGNWVPISVGSSGTGSSAMDAMTSQHQWQNLSCKIWTKKHRKKINRETIVGNKWQQPMFLMPTLKYPENIRKSSSSLE